MSLDYPDRSVWLAKRSTWRNRHKHERLLWTGGTYVRKRSDPRENARLTEFANRCNGNRRAKRSPQ